MVSGFNTSPLEISRIFSGDERLIVILEKLLVLKEPSFLKAICFELSDVTIITHYGIPACG
jgi:hypothetical protein